MSYLQHTDPLICVPQHISRYGIYSGHLFLLSAIGNYAYNHKSLALISTSLYITTMLHWYKIKNTGLIKTIDIATSIIAISSITFYDSSFFCYEHRIIWCFSAFVSIVVYLINTHIYFYQQQYNSSYCFIENEPYRYFSLKYTRPNTLHRELAYKYSVFIHIIFLHVNLVFTCGYGIINAPTCENYHL